MAEAELSQKDIEFIKELREARDEGLVNRRQALGLLAGIGIGGAGGYAAVGGASADPSTSDSDGNVGTPSDPVDVFAEGLGGPTGDVVDVGSNLDLKSSQEIQNASSIITDGLTFIGRAISAIIDGDETGLRMERGTATHSDPSAPSDGTWNTSNFDGTAVTFDTAFSSSPIVVDADTNGDFTGGKNAVNNVSTTGFDSNYRRFKSDSLGGSGAPDHNWIAIGPE